MFISLQASPDESNVQEAKSRPSISRFRPKAKPGRPVARAIAAALTAATLALSGCTTPPEPQDKTIAASLPDGGRASVVFPGHNDLTASVEAKAVTPEMTAALPVASAHISNAAEFKLEEGNFPSTGAQVSFKREKAAPTGSFSVIAHWNADDQAWEPSKTSQSGDRLTLTTTVQHFSTYAILDLLKDIVGSVLGDQQSKEQLVNGTSQWLGVQTAPPSCSGPPKPEWASVTGSASINNIFTWCASGSEANPDRLVVKATLNRSYAGYFRTAVEPVSATLVGLSSDAPLSETSSRIGSDGFIDWKTVGAMMGNSPALVNADEDTIGDIFPVMPFATYEFEFTKSALLLGWQDIEKSDTQLVTFSTTPVLTFAGLLSGAVDLGIAKASDRWAFVVLLFQLNDCFRSEAMFSGRPKEILTGDGLLAITNCVTAVDNNVVKNLARRLADEGSLMDRATNLVEDSESKFAKMQKVFQVVAAAEIGVTLGVAFNDFVTTLGAEKRLHFTPNGDGYKAFLAGPWTTYSTADKKLQFLYPHGWQVLPGEKNQFPLSGENLKVVNEKGETMAGLVTGFVMDSGMAMTSLRKDRFRDLDLIPAAGLKPVLDITENKVLFQAFNIAGDRWSASMGVNSVLKTDTNHVWTRGFDIAPGTGGSFGRNIAEDTPLTDVDPALRGLARLEAYKRTSEFHKIRTMLESLRDYVSPTINKQPPRETNEAGWPIEKPWDADTAAPADDIPWAQ